MNQDTDLGGSGREFPATRCSLLVATGSADAKVRRDAFAALVAAYWKPVYKYVRLKWSISNEDAKDFTQGFFARALEKGLFEQFDPALARFRTYLRVCVDSFLSNEHKAASRVKRGGEETFLSFDFQGAEGELCKLELAASHDLDSYFHQEWVRSVFALAVDDLRHWCAASEKSTHFALFERYDLDGPNLTNKLTYAELAHEFSLSIHQVTNFLALVRRQFRQFLLDQVRATTGSEEEFQEETRRLLGDKVS
jgi:DNA-directed RNA polymerase specialized sigma24 family protein